MDLTNFERYSVDLDATDIEHKTKRQLAGLHSEALRGNQRAWQDLWLYGTKLVLKICNKLRREELLHCSFEDAVAEGNLAIGEALTRWNPKKSSFGTWVWIRVRGAILNENNKALARGMNETSFTVEAVDREGQDTDLDGLNQEDIDSPYLDPEESIEYAELWDLISTLPEVEQYVVVMYYFEDLPQRDISTLTGVSQQRVSKVLKRAEARLGEIFK